ncbi:MAG: nucleotidyl transferase AbiEii/AbiGii toxin family protein, partial [Actinomycetes bacterium]
MIEPRSRPPGNVQHLQRLVEELAAQLEQPALRLRITVANTVVGQMLPPGAVKGGSAMKLRLGETRTRFTPDLDFARAGTLERFEEDFGAALESGWSGFNGRLVRGKPPKPAGVPDSYVMRPFEVRLTYKGRSWLTVLVEVGHDELGDTDDPVPVVSSEIVELFLSLGLERPAPIPVLTADHQIAQKLHALSSAGSERAHDLVDLQLLVAAEAPDLSRVRDTCER